MHVAASLVFFLGLLPLAWASSAPITITQPTVGTVWTAGSLATIYWAPATGTTATNGPVKFDLVWGNPNAFQTLGTLVTSPSAALGQVTFTVQSNLPQSNQYAIKSGSAYTPLFTINNPNNTAPATGSFPVLNEAQPLSQNGQPLGSGSGTAHVYAKSGVAVGCGMLLGMILAI